jgi:hypothetical protein
VNCGRLDASLLDDSKSMYYHARITLRPRSAKSYSSTAFELDLERQRLVSSIALPFLRQETFYCGGLSMLYVPKSLSLSEMYDFAKLALGHQQSAANPTLDVIAVAPAFNLSANGFDVDHVRAAQGTAELVRRAPSRHPLAFKWNHDRCFQEADCERSHRKCGPARAFSGVDLRRRRSPKDTTSMSAASTRLPWRLR